MKHLSNIEKSAFRKGEYVGSSAIGVFRIHKTNSTYGNWVAYYTGSDERQILYAFRLADLSTQLTAVQ